MTADTPARPWTPPGTKPDSASRRVARMLGITERRAQKESMEVFRRAATYLRVWREMGFEQRVAAGLAAIDGAVGTREVPPLPLAAHAETCADAHEDLAEAAFRLTPSPLTARALIRASAAARLRMEEREEALRREFYL